MSIIKVGGIDPSLRSSGFGIITYNDETEELSVSNCGLIKTPTGVKKTGALVFMIESMHRVAKLDAWKACDNVIVEFPPAMFISAQVDNKDPSSQESFKRKRFSAGAITPVAGVSGACIGAFQKNDRVIPVYPMTWNRGRKKEETRGILEEYLGMPEEWLWDYKCTRTGLEHVYDALGTAFWCLEKYYFKYPEGEDE